MEFMLIVHLYIVEEDRVRTRGVSYLIFWRLYQEVSIAAKCCIVGKFLKGATIEAYFATIAAYFFVACQQVIFETFAQIVAKICLAHGMFCSISLVYDHCTPILIYKFVATAHARSVTWHVLLDQLDMIIVHQT